MSLKLRPAQDLGCWRSPGRRRLPRAACEACGRGHSERAISAVEVVTPPPPSTGRGGAAAGRGAGLPDCRVRLLLTPTSDSDQRRTLDATT
jgi:hypothetical protein